MSPGPSVNFDRRLCFGIPAPETPEDAKDHLQTLDGMRRAIEKASHDSALIRNALNTARIQGLSAEDTYVFLAYHALRFLEDAHQRESAYLQLTAPSFRPRKEDVPRG